MRHFFFVLLAIASAFVANSQEVSIDLIHQADGPFLVEGCTVNADSLVISRLDTTLPANYQLRLSGSASFGEDFDLDLAEINFQEGQDNFSLGLIAIPDEIAEDRETLVIAVLDSMSMVIDSLEILILDALEVVIEQEEVRVCQGEQVTLSTVIPGNYLWIYDGDTTFGPELSLMANDEKNVRVITTLGDCEASDEIDIQLRAGITFNVDTAYACLGESATVTVDIIGNPDGDYIWSPLDSTITVLADQSIQVMTDVTRKFFLNFRNSECDVLDSVVIRVDSLPDFPIRIVPEKETYCPGEKVVLSSVYLFPPLFPDAKFEWSYDAASPISEDTLENFVFTTEDTSYFRLKVDNNACQMKDSVMLIVINPPVELSLTDTTVCPNQPVKVELLNADDFDEIMWSPEQGISCTDCPDPTMRVESSTSFMMTGKSMGCPASGTVNINIFPADSITVVPDTMVCPGDPVRLSALETSLYEELEWTGTNLDCNKCNSPVTNPQMGNTTYAVLGVKEDGCFGEGSLVISTFPTPNPFLVATPAGAQEIGTLIEIQTSLVSTNTFTWSVNGQTLDGSDATIETPIVTEGDNTFKVEVVSPEGCMGMGEITITGNPPHYEIPSAFTPNNDELNDTFKVLVFGNFQVAEFKVFNRWGQVVFEGSGDSAWDGRFKGKNAPADVYAYQAVLRLPDNSEKTVRGEVALIR